MKSSDWRSPLTVLTAMQIAACSLSAQESIDAQLSEFCQKHEMPALCAVAFSGDKILAQGVAGVRKLGDPAPARLEDRWHLGSITKSMTSSLAAMLVEEGKLTWDVTVKAAIPKSAPVMAQAFETVTLRQLLEHRSGIHRDGPPGVWDKLRTRPGTVAEQRQWWVDNILRSAPEHQAQTYHYSNAGYAVAGHMLECAAHEPWETLISRRLFKPLKMTTAGFGPTASPGKVDGIWGHTSNGKPVPPGPDADNPPALGPAGTVHCSLPDFVPYAQWHLREGGGTRLLTPESMRRLHTADFPEKSGEGYAAGWTLVQRPWAGGTTLSHTGTNTMNFAVVWLAPKRKFGFVVATNMGGDRAATACDSVAAFLAGKLAAASQQ